MKKGARISEKLVSPGLPGLQVATRLGKDGKRGRAVQSADAQPGLRSSGSLLAGAIFPFVNGRCHLEQSLPFLKHSLPFITVVAISIHASNRSIIPALIIRISGSQHVISWQVNCVINFKSYKMADQQQLLQHLITSAIEGVKKNL